MNHIRYVEYNARHNRDFIFDQPLGHDCWLLLLTHTEALFEVKNQLKKFPPDSAVLFCPNQPIHYRSSGDFYENDWIRFDSDEIYVQAFSVQNEPFSPMDPEYCHEIIKLLAWEKSMHSEGTGTIIDQLLHILFFKLNESVSNGTTLINQMLSNLKKEIYNFPQQAWTVESMAEKVHLSAGYLQLLYKKMFDISCMNDVIASRVRRAKDQLLHTNLTVNEIALRCGYQNIEHFHRQFKKTVGVTPLAYRKNESTSKS